MTIPKVKLKETKWALCDKEEGVVGISEVAIIVPPTTYCNNENNFVHFLGHLNSTGRPPLTKSWDYRCAICIASFCSAGDQTRTFMHARQAHYQLSYYLTPKEFFSDNILHFLKGQVELKMILAD